jgi:hypothetical protein
MGILVVFCQGSEYVSHLFFHCNIIKEFGGGIFKDILKGEGYKCLQLLIICMFVLIFLYYIRYFGVHYYLLIVWIIWIEQNKKIFQGIGDQLIHLYI